MFLVDESISAFFEKNGYSIDDSSGRLKITGQPEVKIFMSILLILVGIPLLVFFAIQLITIYHEGLGGMSFLILFVLIVFLTLWVVCIKVTMAPAPKLWLEFSDSGIMVPEKGFFPAQQLESFGLKTKKLAGVLSAAYQDNLHRKCIYAVVGGREIDLLVFETTRAAIEIDMKSFIQSMATHYGLTITD